MERSNQVKSIWKAFMILEELDRSRELSLQELSQKLDMDKGTLHRILSTLKDGGYVRQNTANRKYANSLKLLQMGSNVLIHEDVRTLAEPFIKELAEKSGETVNLGQLFEKKVTYIDKIESKETIRVGLGVGKSIPLYCTGLGKSILAFQQEQEIDRLMDGVQLHAYTSHTVSNRDELMNKLLEIRKNGYCIDDEEYVAGLISFGAPIYSLRGQIQHAVSIAIPKYRYQEERDKDRIVRLITSTARRISEQLGYQKG